MRVNKTKKEKYGSAECTIWEGIAQSDMAEISYFVFKNTERV